jgi:hypothetical protein
MARRHQRRRTAFQPSARAKMGVAADVDGARGCYRCV